MELKEFLEVLKQRWRFVLVITLLCSGAAAIVSYLLPVKYRSQMDVYVSKESTSKTGDFYTYDGYYAAKSSVEYTSTVAGFFESLQVLRNAAANLDNNKSYVKSVEEPELLAEDFNFLEKIADKVIVENLAPQILQASFTHEDEAKSKLWINSLGMQVVKTVNELNVESGDDYNVEISAEPLTKEVRPSLILNVTAGLLIGLVLGIGSAYMAHYLKEED